MRFEESILRTIRDGGLVAAGERVLVAVSGGPDSMALLHALVAIAPRLGVSVAVAHLDHELRGEESAADAAFVRDAAAALGVPARVESVRVARARGESLEAAARRVRYAFLERAAAELGCARIATGHTADDQAETVLMRLFRGAGPRGLAGIRAERAAFGTAGRAPHGAAVGQPLRVIRPLLARTRDEILTYLDERAVAYRTDSTNAQHDALRNRVRSEILPRVATLVSPSAVRTLARFAERERAIDRFLAAEAARRIDGLVRGAGAGWLAIDVAGLAASEPALRPYIARLAVERVAASRANRDEASSAPRAARLEDAHIAACLALARGDAARRERRLPGAIVVRRVGDRLEFIDAGRSGADGFRPALDVPGEDAFRLALDVPGEVAIPGGGARLTAARVARSPASGSVRGAAGVFHVEFDWCAVHPPLEVRSRRPGDRIAPRGMAGSKSIQNLFVDRKVPWTEREGVPIVADRERMLWVVGHAVTREAPVTDATRETLVLSFESSDPFEGDR